MVLRRGATARDYWLDLAGEARANREEALAAGNHRIAGLWDEHERTLLGNAYGDVPFPDDADIQIGSAEDEPSTVGKFLRTAGRPPNPDDTPLDQPNDQLAQAVLPYAPAVPGVAVPGGQRDNYGITKDERALGNALEDWLFNESQDDDRKSGGAEHTKGARPSTKDDHERGQTRRLIDSGNEKGDERRRDPRKRPPGWRGPYPPKDRD
jgi:hypothetical protein